MDVDEDNLVSTSIAQIPVNNDNQTVVSYVGRSSLVSGSTFDPPAISPPVTPSIAPIFVSTPRSLGPVPVHPPVLSPAVALTGEAMVSDSDSKDESGPSRAAGSSAEYEISEESILARERQEKAVQELLMRRRAAALAVPTNDLSVRIRLRHLGEPITLFGEREIERRGRLRNLMVRLDSEGQLESLMKAHEDKEACPSTAPSEGPEEEIQYPFYTEGPNALLEARLDITRYSIAKAALRLHRVKRRRDDPDKDLDVEVNWASKQASTFALDCSEFGDDRPLSGCSFSRDGSMLATCSLSRVAKIWSMPNPNKIATLKGHTERVTDVAFSPTRYHLATASADKTARLWSKEGVLLNKFQGHLDRLAHIAFHPSGDYLGTTSFDKTWRLWHVETGEELLLQEGHSRSVYGIAFQSDGALVASCGLDALVRVWDLRSGRSILVLEGHVNPVFCVDFSPNSYHLVSGGEDNTCRIWDLRKKRSLYVIPAHSNLISEVKFEPQGGSFLVTGSYDTTVKVWSSKDFKPVKTLSGHEAKVTSLDIVKDSQFIATVSHDRTIKLWSTKSEGKDDKEMDVN